MHPEIPKTILISRTDSIGDVVLTLPLAGIIKKYYPETKILFLGRNYTQEVVGLSEYVDEFISWDALSVLPIEKQIETIKSKGIDAIIHVFPNQKIALLGKKAMIPFRVGTKNRFFHWFTCNKLVSLSRKNSNLHEAELNQKLLEFLKINPVPKEQVHPFYGFTKVPSIEKEFESLIDPNRLNVILHPKSKGSAREWGLENFSQLIRLLPETKYKVFISGNKEEHELVKPLISDHPNVTDISGKMSLRQFIGFISRADALVAASTGPLHIAAGLNKKAIGLFAPMRPIHPGRWSPLGINAKALVLNKNCNDCRKTMNCHCIRAIQASEVLAELEK